MNAIRSDILPAVAKSARTSVQVVAASAAAARRTPKIQFLINGPDLRKLDVLSQQLLDKMKALPGVVDPRPSLNSASRSCRCRSIGRRRPTSASRSAMRPKRCGWLVGGDQVTTYNEGSEQYEVHLRAAGREPLDPGRRSAGSPFLVAAWQRFRWRTSPTSRTARRRPTSTGSRGSGR